MSGEAGDAGREWAADKRDFVADERDVTADARDDAADARDVVAAARDEIADARETQMRIWEQQLRARAQRLGLLGEDDSLDEGLEDAATAHDANAAQRAASSVEREEAARARDLTASLRSAQRRDTLVAAAFAGIAEYLQESQTAEQLLARIAEAAVTTIAGATSATLTTDNPATADDAATQGGGPTADNTSPSMSFPFRTATGPDADPRTASLHVYTTDPAALDEAAQDLGAILAAHAALAARTLGERIQLEQLAEQLEHALMSRDVIGQAKGILMERLKTTSEDAFNLLKRTSQLLNTKLREVARTLTETGELPPTRPSKP